MTKEDVINAVNEWIEENRPNEEIAYESLQVNIQVGK